ncbi:hypothetical protein AGMMS49593_09770 [Endomicrobiia bacterium]|nr:hypothetical protein AGMMS49593_09770 [Endomicrobiia bacterium]
MGIMKKFLFLVLLVLSVFSANVFAGELDVWGGYTRLDSSEIASLENMFNYIKNLKGKGAKVSGKLGNAVTVGLDYFGSGNKNVKPGFRVAYLQSGSKIKMSSHENTTSANVSLISVMSGIKLNRDISEKFSLNGKLFLGRARGRLSTENGTTGEDFDDVKYLFAADVSIGAQYLFTEKFGLGLDLGYRPFPSDLSGFTAKLGLNFKI